MTKLYSVTAVRRGKIWVSIGIGRVEADGSINVELDSLPLDGKLHLRPKLEEPEVKGEVFVDVEPTNPKNLRVMMQKGDRAELLGTLTDAIGWPLDLVFQRAASAALQHHANLASEWCRLRTPAANRGEPT